MSDFKTVRVIGQLPCSGMLDDLLDIKRRDDGLAEFDLSEGMAAVLAASGVVKIKES